MNPFITNMAKELAHQLNKVINIPFVSEEEEELFFQLVVTKVFEMIVTILGNHLNKQDVTNEPS